MNHKMHESQRLINHVALVLDGSGSMIGLEKKVIEVADEQIRQLALRSEQLKQETRVSIYVFSGDNRYAHSNGPGVKCLIFDMDAMRSPSIAELYSADGGTPLVDAVVKSQEDLATTSQLYGDHAFLTLVITDGEENTSKSSWSRLAEFTSSAKENWTVGFFVPNQQGITYLTRAGVDKGNITIWDAASVEGVLKAGNVMRSTVDAYMTARASGVRGTKSLFTLDTTTAKVNAKTVAMTMKPMDRSSYSLHDVHARQQIGDFVNDTLKLGPYYIGKGFYQFMKPETIQGDKAIIVVNKSTGQAYEGVNARSLIGLTPGVEAKVRPAENPEFDIFVQSKAINRNLIPGTKMLLLK